MIKQVKVYFSIHFDIRKKKKIISFFEYESCLYYWEEHLFAMIYSQDSAVARKNRLVTLSKVAQGWGKHKKT